MFLNTVARTNKYFFETKMLFNVLMKKFNHKTPAVKLYHFSFTQLKVIDDIKICVRPVLANKKKHFANFWQMNNLFRDLKAFLAGESNKFVFSSSLCQVTYPGFSSSDDYLSVSLYSSNKLPFCFNNLIYACIKVCSAGSYFIL